VIATRAKYDCQHLLLFHGATQECLKRFQQVAHQKIWIIATTFGVEALRFLDAARSVSMAVSDAPTLVIAYRDAFHRWLARS
jgi:hypothetical protein